MLNMQYHDAEFYKKESFLMIITCFLTLLFSFIFINLTLCCFVNTISLSNKFIFSTFIKTQHLNFFIRKCY